MKTITQLVYVNFSEHSRDGVSYMIYNEDMREYLDGQEGRKFVCEVVIPKLSYKDVVEMGVAAIDKEIIDLQVQITAKEAKKQQLLAIEHKGVESE